MKTAALFFAFAGLAWAFPKDTEDLQFKRLYVDPLKLPDNAIPRITNGYEVVPHSIPYQAMIVTFASNGVAWMCGGSLITPRYVLTAAHCLIGGASAQVYLGAHNFSQLIEPSRILITSVDLIPHADFDGASISNDIGLIGLPVRIIPNEEIKVATLPSRRGEVDEYVGNVGITSGWGLTSGDSDISQVLLAVNSTIISNQVCNSYYGIVQDEQVCTSGAQGQGTCNGDSGGPLVVDGVQIGITSYGAAGCLAGYPSVYTSVDAFLDWIEIHTELTL